MANKISTCLGNIETGLGSLVSDTLKAVKREVINPMTEKNLPVLGISISRFRRTEDDCWHTDVLLQLVAFRGGDESDETLIDLVKAITANIQALIDAGSAGGHVHLPIWDTWHTMAAGGALRKIGAVGSLEIVVADPL